MKTENIWENLKLDEVQTSAYDLLISQADNFTKATKSELIMDVEIIQTIQEGEYMRLYILYIVVPSLGNFRKQILAVVEYLNIGRFPVSILSRVGDDEVEGVKEEDFLKQVKIILSKNEVQRTIENLYRQSLEAKKYHSTKAA